MFFFFRNVDYGISFTFPTKKPVHTIIRQTLVGITYHISQLVILTTLELILGNVKLRQGRS